MHEALALHRTVRAAIIHVRPVAGDREIIRFHEYVLAGGPLPELDGLSATVEGYRRPGYVPTRFATDYLTEARIIVRDRRPTGGGAGRSG